MNNIYLPEAKADGTMGFAGNADSLILASYIIIFAVLIILIILMVRKKRKDEK